MVELHKDERIDQLVREDLQIIQSREVFSFGMDAVLLAKYPKIPKKGLIVDLCAGNGAVSMLAAAYTKADIKGVEIQERLADMFQRSVQLNHLEDQFQVICDNLKEAKNYIAPSTVDLIYCNPPYFKAEEAGKINDSQHFSLARHELTTNMAEICQVANQLLKPKGHLAMVHRPERFFELVDNLRSYNLIPKRIQFVHPKSSASANMVLIDVIKDASPTGEIFESPLIVRDSEGNYSKELLEIYYGKA